MVDELLLKVDIGAIQSSCESSMISTQLTTGLPGSGCMCFNASMTMTFTPLS